MAATDTAPTSSPGRSDPIERAVLVVPSDSADLSIVTRAVYVGVSGDLKVTLVSGDTVTFVSAPIGWHPLRASRIWNTGTTAASILAVW